MLAQLKQNKSLTLLILLLLLILIFPFFEGSRIASVLFVILYTSVLLSGIYAISYDVRYIAIGILLVLPIIVCQWSNIILNSPAIDILSRVASAIFMSYTLIALLQRVLTARRVGLNEIYGAVCVYVLIGTVFGLFYILIESIAPGSFYFSHEQRVHNAAPFIYFSFVTLSTAGYGDIVAIAPFARSVVVIEIIIGVTYVAILIGRLISVSHLKLRGDSAEGEKTERHRKEKALQDFLHEPVLLQKRPVGLIMACIMLNFATSILMTHTHLPFFLDSWATSLAVIMGGWWAGAITAVFYNLLIALTYWGWTSWVWMFCSLLVAAVTWFFCKRGWVSLYKPLHLIAAGFVTGVLNAILAQMTMTLAQMPPYEDTLPVFNFFVKITANKTFSAIAEKLFVEIADKTISIMVAAVAIFLLRDLLTSYKKKLELQKN